MALCTLSYIYLGGSSVVPFTTLRPLNKASTQNKAAIQPQQNPAVVPAQALELSSEPVTKSDPATITSATIKDGKIFVAVTYGGGCNPHAFTLRVNPDTLASTLEPSQQPLVFNLKHTANSDPCEALIDTVLTFDLAPLNAVYTGAASTYTILDPTLVAVPVTVVDTPSY